MGRAEFVLARHEKHRSQMGELVEKLKEESENFESRADPAAHRHGTGDPALGGETKKFETVAGDAERHLELIMANAVDHAPQLTTLLPARPSG